MRHLAAAGFEKVVGSDDVLTQAALLRQITPG